MARYTIQQIEDWLHIIRDSGRALTYLENETIDTIFKYRERGALPTSYHLKAAIKLIDKYKYK